MLAPLLLALAASAADPILGNWLGTVAFESDRVVLALEFKLNDKGEIRASLYQPIINVFGQEFPGAFTLRDGTYSSPDSTLSCSIQDGKLVGTFSSLKMPISLERTDKLPAEAPIPDLPPGPAPLWQANLGAPIYAAVTIHDAMAYIGTAGGVFHAVNTKDGSLAWTYNAGRPIHGSALATDDAVFFVCDNGFLYRLDPATGKESWRYDLGDAQVPRILPHPHVYEYDHRAPRPTLADGRLFVGSGDGSVHAVDSSTGARIWRTATKDKIRADAIVSGPNIIVPSWDHTLYALDRGSGSVTWTYDTKAPISSTPTLVGDHLLVGNRGSVLRSLDPATGVSQWRQLFWGSWVESQPVVVDGKGYVGSSDLRRVTCFDPADGRVIWRSDVLGCPWGTVAVTNTRVYAATMGASEYVMRHVGGFVALDRATGNILWRIPAPPAPGSYLTGFTAGPAFHDSTLILGRLDGTLLAYPAD